MSMPTMILRHRSVKSQAVGTSEGVISFDSEGHAVVPIAMGERLLKLFPRDLRKVELDERVAKARAHLEPLEQDAPKNIQAAPEAPAAITATGLTAVKEGFAATSTPGKVTREPVSGQVGIPFEGTIETPGSELITARENTVIPLDPNKEISKRDFTAVQDEGFPEDLAQMEAQALEIKPGTPEAKSASAPKIVRSSKDEAKTVPAPKTEKRRVIKRGK